MKLRVPSQWEKEDRNADRLDPRDLTFNQDSSLPLW